MGSRVSRIQPRVRSLGSSGRGSDQAASRASGRLPRSARAHRIPQHLVLSAGGAARRQVPSLFSDHPRLPHFGRQHLCCGDIARVHGARGAFCAAGRRDRGSPEPQTDHVVVQLQPGRHRRPHSDRGDRPGTQGRLPAPDSHHACLLRGWPAVWAGGGGRDPHHPAAARAHHSELDGAADDGADPRGWRRARAGRLQD